MSRIIFLELICEPFLNVTFTHSSRPNCIPLSSINIFTGLS